MKNGCEKFDLIPIVYVRIQYAIDSDLNKLGGECRDNQRCCL